MEAEEARKIALQVLFQLQQDNYEACINIIQEAEAKALDKPGAQQESREELECVSNLPIDGRWLGMLEREGYFYIRDLEGVDIDKLNISNLGAKGKQQIKQALQEVRQKLAEVV